jgi:hypothetical protein
MILWLVTAITASIAAVVIAGAYLAAVRRSRRSTVPVANLIKGICVYLRDEYVMDLYQQGDFKALEQEVEETSRRNQEGNVAAEVRGVGARSARKAEEEKVTRYIRKEQPITVIRVIVDDLVRADNIVAVDLIDMRFEPGPALDQALRGSRRRVAHLRDLDTFVLVRGRFRETAKTADTVTFSAPYGDAAPQPTTPQVDATCVTARLRHRVPEGPFLARCLGRIQWDPETRDLTIDPIAIFR